MRCSFDRIRFVFVYRNDWTSQRDDAMHFSLNDPRLFVSLFFHYQRHCLSESHSKSSTTSLVSIFVDLYIFIKFYAFLIEYLLNIAWLTIEEIGLNSSTKVWE